MPAERVDGWDAVSLDGTAVSVDADAVQAFDMAHDGTVYVAGDFVDVNGVRRPAARLTVNIEGDTSRLDEALQAVTNRLNTNRANRLADGLTGWWQPSNDALAAFRNFGVTVAEAGQQLNAAQFREAAGVAQRHKAQRQAADERAEQLLFDHLSDEQRQSWADHDYFHEAVTRNGQPELYRFHRYHNPELLDGQGQAVASFCIQTDDAFLPRADQVLARLLLLRVAPDTWHATANRSDYGAFAMPAITLYEHHRDRICVRGFQSFAEAMQQLADFGREMAEAFSQRVAHFRETTGGGVNAQAVARRQSINRLLRLDTRPPRSLQPMVLRGVGAWGRTYLPRGRGPPC